MRAVATFIFTLLIVLVSGCGFKMPVPTKKMGDTERETINKIDQIYVMQNEMSPRVTSEFFAEGKGTAALKGAGKGLKDTMGMMRGSEGPGAALVFIVTAPLMMTGESIYYATMTPGSTAQKTFTRDFNVTAATLKLNTLLADAVIASGNQITEKSFARLPQEDMNLSRSASESCSVGMLEVGTRALHYDDNTESIRFTVQSTLSVPCDKDFMIERTVSLSLPVETIETYLEDNATGLKQEIKGIYQRLATQTISSIFYEPEYEIRVCQPGMLGPCAAYYGWYSLPDALKPQKPAMEMDIVSFSMGALSSDKSGAIQAGRVESLEPTLSWEPFPPSDLKEYVEPVILSNIEEVVYDLVVLEATGKAVVYERYGLPEADHKLEEPLRCGKKYRWTVRARYYRDGFWYASHWSRFKVGDYAFVTPACDDTNSR